MADVASLAVALHLNAASFKSDVEDAYNSASASSKNSHKISAGSRLKRPNRFLRFQLRLSGQVTVLRE